MLVMPHLLSPAVRVPHLVRARPAAAMRTSVAVMVDEPEPQAGWRLPFDPFDWSALWGGDEADAEPKLVGLPASELAALLAEDLTQRKYIVTGDLTPSLFADDCRFVDPNNAVRGLGRYRKALSFLFEPAASRLGNITYTLDPQTGLVAAQTDVWNITRLDAIRQSFTPGPRTE